MVSYLKELRGVKKKMNRLVRIHEEVTRAHASLVEENACAGINTVREAKTAEVNSIGLIAMSTSYADMALLEGLESTRNYIENSTESKEELLIEDSSVPSLSVVRKKQTNASRTEFIFDRRKVRGMYDDVTVADTLGIARRAGTVYLVPRGGSSEGGWIGFVVDDSDGTKRACSQRTVEVVRQALVKMDKEPVPGEMVQQPCTYVIGERQQRWAFLGGLISGLSGETAISVVLDFHASSPKSSKLVLDQNTILQHESNHEKHPEIYVPPIGSFRRYCNICKQPYLKVHFFYHQLCQPCGDLNYEKRLSTADMSGRLCLVTGGRVRIGYQIVLKLLRAGATVIATTRWVCDAALRYSYESDYSDWCDRLIIDKLELSDLAETEAYCTYLERNYESLNVLINNAAQTITRPPEWTAKMNALEMDAYKMLPDKAKKLINSKWMAQRNFSDDDLLLSFRSEVNTTVTHANNVAVVIANAEGALTFPTARRVYDPNNGGWLTFDESGQPLDLSGVNSWSKRLAEVDVTEMAQTMAVNSMAPFILCSRLKQLLSPVNSRLEGMLYSHIINVTALEGKFNVGKKSGGHPHTNMSKAALNMLTLTASRAYASDGILMNSVDTGWVTDMAPKGLGAQAKIHETFIGPPLDDLDGASRVLDPVFDHINSGGKDTSNGHFWKDYMKSNW